MIEVEKAIKVSVGIDIKVSENGLLPK